MGAVVAVSLLLKPEWRTAEGRARVAEAAQRMGLAVTGQGAASVSCRAEKALFERLFGCAATDVPARPPGPADFGAPAGAASLGEPRVPQDLAMYVAAASVLPPATRLR